jgi:hypothetical protein
MDQLILEICSTNAVRKIDSNTISVLFSYQSDIIDFRRKYISKLEFVESSGSHNIWAAFRIK